LSKKKRRVATAKPRGAIRRFFSILGPGVITGAADDDPSGIATYSIAGAQLGTSLLWTAFLTWPLMAAIQMACARIGMVTGGGLVNALRNKSPKWLLIAIALAVFGANTINIAADLSGMADAAQMLFGLNSHYFVVLFGIGIAWATIRLRYHQIAATLKWLALVLFAYVVTAIVVGPDWSAVLRDTFIPSVPKGRAAWGTLVAILGTTISPYLFFWQASEEVEEEKETGQTRLADRQGATPQELADRRLDVGVGTFFSNMVMFFIILTTALTLHRHGVTNPQTSREVAEALRPFGGRFTQILYTTGLVGVGFLAIPTLSGSAAYAFAETFRWKQGLDRRMKGARYFYFIVIGSTVLGIALDFLKVNAVKALYWSAVLNGLLAPFLLVGIFIVASDRKVMKGQPISRLSRAIIGITAALMFAAAIGMFVL
jgi:NRAMP (natural resistance-associated macrophage protein)-like metal ion transporter